METSAKIMKDLRQFMLRVAQNPEQYKRKPSDFTRKRKLYFSQLSLLLLRLLKSLYKVK